MVIMAPSDAEECRKMLTTGYQYDGPAAVRYPRGMAVGASDNSTLDALPIGKAKLIRKGEKLAILSFGCMLDSCRNIAEHLNASLIDMRFIKPIDENLLLKLVEQHTHFVTVEENAVAGGAGSAVNEFLARQQIQIPLLNIGLPDKFIEHGSRDEVLAIAGLNEKEVEQKILHWLDGNDAQNANTGQIP